jgi:central kinetochore subunit Mis15/CHL4
MATAPDYKNIPHSHRLPVAHREVQRTLTKLSRQSLLSLAPKHRRSCLTLPES